MKRLILFRHGKTERHATNGEDFDRRLTVRGCEDSHRMGQLLAAAGFTPDLVLVSSAVRAQETWGAAKAAFPDAKADTRPELYNSDARELVRMARAQSAETVMIIAHNPGLHVLTESLVDRAGDEALAAKIEGGFPTAGLSAFDFDGETVTALGLFFPRDHGGGSGHD